MPKFTSKTENQEQAIFASSGGEAVHGESRSPLLAGIAGILTNTDPKSTGGSTLSSTQRIAIAVWAFIYPSIIPVRSFCYPKRAANFDNKIFITVDLHPAWLEPATL
jgi:hypothetical protein